MVTKLYFIFVPKKEKYMAISIISAKQFTAKLKATIQSTGKLGFTGETAKCLNLQAEKHAKFAKDDETKVLYLILMNMPNEDAFPIKSTSGYYYAATTRMFDMLGLDYRSKTIMFDLIRQNSLDADLGGEVYLMKQRHGKNKEKNNDDSIE